ncbi:MAG: hypothetical protein FJW29_08380, partial [Acidobacteria bacterium]|nr:hypothetical protein [Acidobacteriota bacterium]
MARSVARRSTALLMVTSLLLAGPTLVGAQPAKPAALTRDVLGDVLARVGEQVRQFFARAQSLVCLETVRLQPLDMGLASGSFGRTVESELRLSWDPDDLERRPVEARTLRSVLKVNGHPPRRNDRNDCTDPEQNESETQPLSMLLPDQQRDYVFTPGKPERVDGRWAHVVQYRVTTPMSVSVEEIPGKDDCISFNVEGGTRGRIWIDVETFQVLRLDQALVGLVDIPLPKRAAMRSGGNIRWTLERHDISI